MKSNKAFSLIELLVVIAIISILASLLLPALNRAKTQARSLQCMSNMRSSGAAILQYSMDFNNRVPRHWDSGDPRWIFSHLGEYLESDFRRCTVKGGGWGYHWASRPAGDYSRKLGKDNAAFDVVVGVDAYFWRWSADNFHRIDLRHGNRANVLFFGGHVIQYGPQGLADVGLPSSPAAYKFYD